MKRPLAIASQLVPSDIMEKRKAAAIKVKPSFQVNA